MAVGTKINDQNARPTTTYTARILYTITTDANGHAALQFSGRGQAMVVPASAITVGGGITSFGAGVAPSGQASLESTFNAYRVVSSGFRLFCSANVTESKGVVCVASVVDNIAVGTPAGLNVNDTGFMDYERFPLADMDATWISKPDGPEARKFIDYTVYPSRTKALITFAGCTPTTTVAVLEGIVHWELESIPDTFSARLATHAEPMKPSRAANAQAVLAQAPGAMSGGTKQRTSSLLSAAEQYVASNFSAIADEAGSLLMALM
jgi:hypothetical protein